MGVTETDATRAASRATLAVCGIVAAQAAWLGWQCSRGWFYLDDLSFMAQASRRSLGWGYLTQPVNGHLSPGLRLQFWLMAHISHLDYGATIAGRLVVQAAATFLLYKLLRLVSRSELAPVVVTGCYAFSPLLVPATLYLASSANEGPAQLGAIVALYACVRHAVSGRLGWAVLSGLALFAAACCWEKTAADTAAVLVLLRLGWLSSGTLRMRARTAVREWRAWALMFGPMVGFGAYFAAGDYSGGSPTYSIGDTVHLVWWQWSRSLWPSVIGGPWHWLSLPWTYVSYASPGHPTVVAGQLAFLAVLATAAVRTGWSGAAAWSLPLAAVVVGQVLLGMDRNFYGVLVAIDYHYVFDVAVPMALAFVLAFAPGGAVPVAQRRKVHRSARNWRAGPLVAGVGLVAVVIVVASLVAVTRWTDRWAQSPTRAYVDVAAASLRRAGPTVNLFDTPDPGRIEGLLDTNRYASDLVADAGLVASFDRTDPPPQIIDAAGRIVPAVFRRVAGPDRSSSCIRRLVDGAPATVVLHPDLAAASYFLEVRYRTSTAVTVDVVDRDADGVVLPSRDDSTWRLAAGSGETITALGFGEPSRLTFTSLGQAADVCLTAIAVGFPHPASP